MKNAIQLFLNFTKRETPKESLLLSRGEIPLRIKKNYRAKKYLLKVQHDGSVHLTIPAYGSKHHGLAFAEMQKSWVEKRLKQLETQPRIQWQSEEKILFRGEWTPLESLPTSSHPSKKIAEKHLWRIAQKELPSKIQFLSQKMNLPFKKISIRNQTSRWGSCSCKKTISLNWRLIQTPPPVQDYIMIHELSHLAHMNHSKKFWQLVAQFCPEYKTHEKWLKTHAFLLQKSI